MCVLVDIRVEGQEKMGMKKSWTCFMKDKIKLAFLIVILCITGYTCLKLIHMALIPDIYKEFASEDLRYLKKEEANTGNYIVGQQAFFDGNIQERRQYTTPEMSVIAGTYEVTVTYESDMEGFSCYAYAHDTSIYRTLESDVVCLLPQNHQVTFRIKLNHSVPDLQIRINDPESGTIEIKEITVNQDPVAARILICNTVVLLIIICLLYQICQNYRRGTITRENIGIMTILISVWFLASLLTFLDGMLYFEDLDLTFHLWRIEGIKNGLENGNFPVRLHSSSLNGYGYPSSVMYGELLLYIPAVLRVIGYSVETSYDVFICLVNAAIIASAYLCLNKMMKNKYIAAGGASLYVTSIYFIQAVYMNCSVGEYCAMIFLPVVVYGMWKIYHADDPGNAKMIWLPLTIGVTGVIQSHVLTTVLSVITMGVYALLQWRKTIKKECIIGLFKAMISVMLLNIWFIIPFMDYYLKMDMRIFSKGDKVQHIQRQGVSVFRDIFTSFNGTFDDTSNGTLPKGVGIILFLAIVVFVFLYFSIDKKKQNSGLFSAGKWCSMAAFIYIFLSTDLMPYDILCESIPLFNKIIGMIQFPSRFLIFATLLLVSLWCINFAIMWEYISIQWSTMAMAVIVVLSVMQMGNLMNSIRDSGIMISAYDEAALNFYNAAYASVGQGEYIPQGVDENICQLSSGEIYDITGVISGYRRVEDRYCLECKNSGEETYFELPLLYYMNYEAYDTEQNLHLSCSAGENGRVRVDVPAGYAGTVDVRFRSPWYWRGAEVISLVTMIYLVWKSGKKYLVKSRN